MTGVPEFGSVAQAAEFFGVGQAAVRSGVRDGSIPHVRLGRIIRIPLRLISERLEAGVSAMTAEAPSTAMDDAPGNVLTLDPPGSEVAHG